MKVWKWRLAIQFKKIINKIKKKNFPFSRLYENPTLVSNPPSSRLRGQKSASPLSLTLLEMVLEHNAPLHGPGNWSTRCCFDSVHPIMSLSRHSISLDALNQNNIRLDNIGCPESKQRLVLQFPGRAPLSPLCQTGCGEREERTWTEQHTALAARSPSFHPHAQAGARHQKNLVAILWARDYLKPDLDLIYYTFIL